MISGDAPAVSGSATDFKKATLRSLFSLQPYPTRFLAFWNMRNSINGEHQRGQHRISKPKGNLKAATSIRHTHHPWMQPNRVGWCEEPVILIGENGSIIFIGSLPHRPVATLRSVLSLYRKILSA